MRPLLLLAMLLLAGAVGMPAHAQGAIHRCVDATGRPVFTDRRCSDLDATRVAPAPAASSATAEAAIDASSGLRQCAVDAATLEKQIADAFARHEPNRLAGLILWDDYGEAEAVARIRSLAELVDRPLLELRDGDQAPESGTAGSIYDASQPLRQMLDDVPVATSRAAADGGPVALTAVTARGDGSREQTRFAVEPRAGCLWLLPPSD